MPYITNGELTTNGKTIMKSGETVLVNFTCNTNILLVNSITTCQRDRTRNPQPSCSDIECIVPSLTYGYYVSNAINANSNLTYQSTITPYCFDGYALESSASLTCQNKSQWSGESPSCTPITCGTTPEAFGNGRYNTGGHLSV